MESILTHPVVTLDKELLFNAGVSLSARTINEISGSGSHGRAQKLGDFDTVTKDMLEFINSPPYDKVFQNHGDISWLIDDINNSKFVYPILDTIRYFKEMDPHTYRHQLMVFALSSLVAHDLMPDRGNIMRLSMAGPIHDIGKICVPLDILKKTTPLTKSERGILDNHSNAGFVLMSYYGANPDSINRIVARDHHERRDGSGKPTGKHQVNLLVEIIAVCDIYDALISPRPYRPISYDNRSAIEVLVEMADKGTINMDVVRIIVAHNRGQRPCNLKCDVSHEKRGHEPEGNIYGQLADEPTAT